MGNTDIRHPIQYALTYPERCAADLPPLNLTQLSSLHFEKPDVERFPCISLAYRALRTAGTLPAAMNAANEEAVHAFIDERISFSDIPRVIESVMDGHRQTDAGELDLVLEADRTSRAAARRVIERLPPAARISNVG